MQVSIEGICVFLFLDVHLTVEIVHWETHVRESADFNLSAKWPIV